MVKDVVSAVQKVLSDRVRDPLLGTFLGFFVLWNWKPITLLLFGSFGAFEDRLRYVQELYHFPKANLGGEFFPFANFEESVGLWVSSLLWNYGAPAVTTLLYLFLYPGCKRKAVVWWQKQETKTINAKRAEQRSIVLTQEESARLQMDIDRFREEVEEARRGKYQLASMHYWVCVAASNEWGGPPSDYAVAYGSSAERPDIRAGQWLVYDPNTKDAWFRNRRWERHHQACLVVALLDGPLLLVRTAGNVDWNTWSTETRTQLSAWTWYALDGDRPGMIRAATQKEHTEWSLPPTSGIPPDPRYGCVGFSDDGATIAIHVPEKVRHDQL